MHCHAAERADVFLRNFNNPSERIDTRQRNQLADENNHILCQEFLTEQALPFRGHRDDKVDFSIEKTNLGNFVATLQLMAKGIAFCKSISLLKGMQSTQVKPFKMKSYTSMHARSEKN